MINALTIDVEDYFQVSAFERVASSVAKSMQWSVPQLSAAGGPPPTPGWSVTPA